ncbi:MAG: FGGY-family carbohydrate kinase [Crocosphaera sp.]|nr:FGGY-family carbohydrate kinase [Crocosphaera sp.]MDJ0685793.1 FGGY-family carbohydrate kinase [Alphaproteobacteria bacterium]
MDDVVIGLDSSTTATKAIAWTPDGDAVAEGRADIPLASPQPNHYEQNPDDWWKSTTSALQQVCAAIDPSRIKAVSISNQRETIGFFNRDGRAVRPAMVWLDERARSLVGDLASELGSDPDGTASFHRITGKPVDIVPSVMRVYWMLRAAPSQHAATEIFSDVHGYLTFRLTGRWATSWASADPLGLFDQEAKQWSPEIMTAVGVDSTRLPDTGPPGSILGELTAAAAAETGLNAGTPVVAGGGDGQLAGLGCAALTPETAYLNIGTALVSGVHGKDYLNSLAWRTMGGPTGEGYYYEACLKAGTFIINWFLDTICANDPSPPSELLPQLSKAAGDIPVGSQGLLMLPYWQGVMNPHWNDSARGAFVGLSGAHTRAHMFRALMEGLALEQRLSTSAVEEALGQKVERYIAIGGGAASDLWRQIFANATGKVVARSSTVEASSLGAGNCAAIGAGWFDSFEQATTAMAGDIVTVSDPNPAAHARYGELFEVYQSLYERMAPIYSGLDGFLKSESETAAV